jgi:hypothetical protein
MAYGLEIYTASGALALSSTYAVGWRQYEAISVAETESSSKDYTGIIPSGFTLQALVVPSGVGGSHTVSVSGYVVTWTYFTMTALGPTYQNNPSMILVFYK